ncbi:hypothetical protein DVH24_006403 [Malus domestica]|uniref:Uncharacterized protein n=1 Tax=Malus domestica TaxID=3750 RepID=A0A498KCQ8_MALDO|nr:hypothetical protein DVH24_006403 [Malus domestica]
MEELSVELPTQTIPHCEPSKHSDLQFDRLQPSDEDLDQDKKLEFGQFVARETTLDEEYWTVGLQTCLLKAKSANSARIDGEFCKLVVPKFEPADKILISALRSRSQMKDQRGCGRCSFPEEMSCEDLNDTLVQGIIDTFKTRSEAWANFLVKSKTKGLSTLKHALFLNIVLF